MTSQTSVLPQWFKQAVPDKFKIQSMKTSFDSLGIHTVCEYCHCPNIGECWSSGVATFMILGNRCTRNCRFCAIDSGFPSLVNQLEPDHVAKAVKALGLKYVVVTSVTRDDLEDGGSEQFSKTILAIKREVLGIKVEVLVPDFLGNENLIKRVVDVNPDVFGHNLETVERLSSLFRPQADWQRSLNVLKFVKQLNPELLTKSGFMVGLGETTQEIHELMQNLREADCDLLTIGQYLAPSIDSRHLKVSCFVTPNEFDEYKRFGESIGFKNVLSGPLVRSSYLAEQGYQACQEK